MGKGNPFSTGDSPHFVDDSRVEFLIRATLAHTYLEYLTGSSAVRGGWTRKLLHGNEIFRRVTGCRVSGAGQNGRERERGRGGSCAGEQIVCQTRGRGVSARERTTRTERFLVLAGTFSHYKTYTSFLCSCNTFYFHSSLLGCSVFIGLLFIFFRTREFCFFIDGRLDIVMFLVVAGRV